MKGFTLVELLAVVLILSIITALSVPIVGKVVEEKRFDTVFLDAKTILREVEYNYIDSVEFPITKLNTLNISSVSLSDYDSEQSYVYMDNSEFYIVLIGKNKFDGINACNIKQSSNDSNVGRITCE